MLGIFLENFSKNPCFFKTSVPFNLQKGKNVRAHIVGSASCGELTTAIEELKIIKIQFIY